MCNKFPYLPLYVFPLFLFLDTFPKPSLFAEPSSVVPMGQSVTLWCQGPVHGVGYILHKEGEAASAQLWGSTSNDGAFSITSMSGASTGRYSCCYHPEWTSPIKIQPSNTLELIVTGKRDVLERAWGVNKRRTRWFRTDGFQRAQAEAGNNSLSSLSNTDWGAGR